jgi:hypothetical protein
LRRHPLRIQSRVWSKLLPIFCGPAGVSAVGVALRHGPLAKAGGGELANTRPDSARRGMEPYPAARYR